MNSEIRVAFHSAFSDKVKSFLISILEKKYVVHLSNEYDYYFAQESIYWTKDNMKELLNSDKNAIRIMFCGEAVYPDLNIFDYCIMCQNSHLMIDDRILYLPFIELNDKLFFSTLESFDNMKTVKECLDLLNEKTSFCNFIYSNSKAHFMRDQLFYAISKYKKVDALGKHLNNVHIEDTRHKEDWDTISIALKRPYKFSIAAENATFVGYTSEKIITSMMADTIPIYWGNPCVYEDYNPDAFINVHNYRCLDDLVKDIRDIDNDSDRYCDMLSQPRRTIEQKMKCEEDTAKFYLDFLNIFSDDKTKKSRRPYGTWPNEVYPNFLLLDDNGGKNKINVPLRRFFYCFRKNK